MKRLSLFLLILLAGSLLAPVKAETSYYAVSFDGVDDYVEAKNFNLVGVSEITVLVLAKFEHTSSEAYEFIWLSGSSYDSILYVYTSGTTVDFLVSWGGNLGPRKTLGNFGQTYLFGYRGTATSIDYIVGGQVITSYSASSAGSTNFTYLKINWRTLHKATLYLVLIYNRALSDSEIQAIYDNPMNPPTNGLVLWLSPDSVDPTAGVWADKSGNDGTIVGATAERVSIPTLKVFTYPDLTQLNTTQVNATLINGSSITTLLPTFPVIPYNTTVTLNISYASLFRVFNTTTLTSQIVVYLLNETVITPLLPLNLTTTWGNLRLSNVTQWFSYWPGGKLMVDLLRLDLKGWIRDVFSFSEYGAVGLFLMSVVWFGGVLSAWFRFKRPESALAYGYVLWTVLGSFVTFTPTPLLLVVTPFVVYLSYQIIISFWKKMSGVD